MKKEDLIQVDHAKPWRYEEGEYTVTRGSGWSGPGCHNGCGVLLYTDKEGKLVKVEGDPENPYNQGRLCVRCLALPEVVNHPDRLTYPMKRAGERGEDKWERITWDEAYDTIEREFNKIKAEYGAEAIGFYQGTGRDISAYITRLCYAFGSPNYVYPLDGQACWVPRMAGCFATSGAFWVIDASQQFPDRYDNPEHKAPETVFVWGNNPVVANADGFYGHWIVDLMKRGSKLVVVDPRVTWLASKAELFLQIRPGTDAALALGMLNVIISEDIYDHDFVEQWCTGFEALAERVKEYPVSKVSEITWVSEEKIIKAARLFAQSEGAALQWGLAVDMTRQALPACQALSALFQITGNVENPGGMIAVQTFLEADQSSGRDELISEEVAAKRLGRDKYPLLQYGVQVCSTIDVLEAVETGKPYPLKAAWLQTVNMLACTCAEPQRVLEAYSKLDFIVSVDLFKTPTIVALADIVLPAATYPERNGIVAGCGYQRAEAINKAIQIGECKSDMQINLEIGKRFNPAAYPWDNVEDMFSGYMEEAGKEISFEELRELAPGFMPFVYNKHEKGLLRRDGEPGFNTQSGRIELYSPFYEMCGLDPLPYFEEPSPGPVSTPEFLKDYPLILTTGARNWGMFHSEHRQIPRLRAMRPDPIIQVHPEAAAKYGVDAGDWVWVENHMGRAKRRVELTTIMDPRVVSTDHGWWYPEADPKNLYDVFDVNINNLIAHNPGKSGFGANFKTMLCKIYRVAEGER